MFPTSNLTLNLTTHRGHGWAGERFKKDGKINENFVIIL